MRRFIAVLLLLGMVLGLLYACGGGGGGGTPPPTSTNGTVRLSGSSNQ